MRRKYKNKNKRKGRFDFDYARKFSKLQNFYEHIKQLKDSVTRYNIPNEMKVSA